jgi:hypothetical protein
MDEHERATEETVTVPRMTAATAMDLLCDYRREFEQANADGPYREELAATIEQLERVLRR